MGNSIYSRITWKKKKQEKWDETERNEAGTEIETTKKWLYETVVCLFSFYQKWIRTCTHKQKWKTYNSKGNIVKKEKYFFFERAWVYGKSRFKEILVERQSESKRGNSQQFFEKKKIKCLSIFKNESEQEKKTSLFLRFFWLSHLISWEDIN